MRFALPISKLLLKDIEISDGVCPLEATALTIRKAISIQFANDLAKFIVTKLRNGIWPYSAKT